MENDPPLKARRLSTLAEIAGYRTTAENDQLVRALADVIASSAPTITGLWYLEKRIELDGFRFVSCRFDKCIVVVRKGNIDIDGCYFAGCTFEFHDEALSSVRLYNINNVEALAKSRDLVPVYFSDGRVSIRRSP